MLSQTQVAFRAQSFLLTATCESLNPYIASVTWPCLAEIQLHMASFDISDPKWSTIVFIVASLKTILAWHFMKRGQSIYDFIVLSISVHVLVMVSYYT